MKNKQTIALFGGTGFVGSHMLEILLQHGLPVKMMVRSAAAVEARPELTLIEGDLKSRSAIEQTLETVDAVIVMTGPRTGSIEDMKAVVEGTRMIVELMEAKGIKRLLKLSGVSVRLKGEPFPLPRRLLDIGLGLAMKYPSQSKYLEQEIIESCSLDWTVMRPPVISKDTQITPLKAHDYAFLGISVGVNSLCQFFLEQLESSEWLRKSPTLG